jgi:hypothetical protein
MSSLWKLQYIYRQCNDPQTLQLSRCFLIHHLANFSLIRCVRIIPSRGKWEKNGSKLQKIRSEWHKKKPPKTVEDDMLEGCRFQVYAL